MYICTYMHICLHITTCSSATAFSAFASAAACASETDRHCWCAASDESSNRETFCCTARVRTWEERGYCYYLTEYNCRKIHVIND